MDGVEREKARANGRPWIRRMFIIPPPRRLYGFSRTHRVGDESSPMLLWDVPPMVMSRIEAVHAEDNEFVRNTEAFIVAVNGQEAKRESGEA